LPDGCREGHKLVATAEFPRISSCRRDQLPPEECPWKALAQAHEAVARAGRGGATTLTVALMEGDDLYVANVGDSPPTCGT